MDFEELLSQQKSFDALAAYLNGSTVNVDRRTDIPSGIPAPTSPRTSCGSSGSSPLMGRDFTAADNTSGRRRRWRSSATAHGSAISAAPPTSSAKGVRINGKAATIIGVMPKGFAFPTNEEIWIPALQRVPTEAAERSRGQQSGGARPAQRRRLARSGQRRSDDDREAVRRGVSRIRTSSSTPGRSSRCWRPSRRARCAARCGRCSAFASACCSSRA